MKWYKNIWLWSFVILISDRVSKYWVMEHGWWQLNTGGVFGLAPGNWWILIVLAMIVFLLYEIRVSSGDVRKVLILLVVAGGSNVIDRVVFGGVIDFIVYPVFGFVGNIADAWLTLAGIILIVQNLKLNIQNPKLQNKN